MTMTIAFYYRIDNIVRAYTMATALSRVSGTDHLWELGHWESGRPQSVKLQVAAKSLIMYQLFKAQVTLNASIFVQNFLG